MGLDMFLSADKYVSEYTDPDLQIALNETVKVRPGPVSNITVEVGYWRKANHIHNWFVQKCQNGVDECQRTYVSRDQLRELLDTCKQVLENHKLAPNLLPTQPGFFFGSTDYDQGYYQDIEATVKILEPVLDSTEFDDWTLYYQSSW